MKALLLAAGYATRLYPLTLDKPKPLLEVGSRPIIDYIIANIRRIKAIDEVFVITNHKFFGHFKKWSARLPSDAEGGQAGYKGPTPIKVIDDGTLSNEDRLRGPRGITVWV